MKKKEITDSELKHHDLFLKGCKEPCTCTVYRKKNPEMVSEIITLESLKLYYHHCHHHHPLLTSSMLLSRFPKLSLNKQ